MHAISLSPLTLHTDKYGWQSSIALWLLVGLMTATLRYIDVRYLRPKREAFDAAAYNDVDPDMVDGAEVGKSTDGVGKNGSVEVDVRRVGSPA